MASGRSAELTRDDVTIDGQRFAPEKTGEVAIMSSSESASEGSGRSNYVPLRMKLISILMVTAIGFGSHWSSGVTGAMKSTLKKVRSD
jgi:hypothetical protein